MKQVSGKEAQPWEPDSTPPPPFPSEVSACPPPRTVTGAREGGRPAWAAAPRPPSTSGIVMKSFRAAGWGITQATLVFEGGAGGGLGSAWEI